MESLEIEDHHHSHHGINHTTHDLTSLEGFRYFGITIGFIDIFIGGPGNIITILAVLGNKALLRQPFNLFLVNLSIIDLITSLVMMPFNVTGYIHMRWPYGDEMCIVQAFVYFTCGYTSVVFLMAITLNRLIGILYPTRYHFISAKSVKISLIFCWLTAALVLLPTMVATFWARSTGNMQHILTGWKQEQFLCTFVNVHDGWQTYMLSLRFLFQFLPIFAMTFSYAAMYYKIKKTNKRHQETNISYLMYKNRIDKQNSRSDEELHQILPSPKRHRSPFMKKKLDEEMGKVYEIKDGKIEIHCIPLSAEKRETVAERQAREQRAKEIRLVHVSIIVCTLFTILFLPSCIINFLPGSHFFDPRWHMAASNLTWLNSCINPFVYAFMHKPMQKEYKVVLKRLASYIQRFFCKIRDLRG